MHAIKGHDCDLDEFHAHTTRSTWRSRLKKFCNNMILASMDNGRLLLLLRSTGAIRAEKQRQKMNPRYRYVIHPFSPLRVFWQMVMLCVYFLSFVLIPLNSAFPDKDDREVELQICIVLNFLCGVDMFMSFMTGYVDQETQEIVMDRSRIAKHYLTSFFVIDLIHTLPFQYAFGLGLQGVEEHEDPDGNPYEDYQHVALFMALFRLLRTKTCLDLATQFCEICRMSPIKARLVRTTFVFTFFTHWCACILYFVPFKVHGNYLVSESSEYVLLFMHSWINLFNTRNSTLAYKYSSATYYVSTIVNAIGHCSPPNTRMLDDMIVESLILLTSLPLNAYLFMTFFHIATNSDQAAVKYMTVLNELESFMRIKRLPHLLQEKFLAFYVYRYDEKYFNEHSIMNALSEAMRREVDMYSCHRLVECVAVFYYMPRSVVVNIVGSLRVEVYLPTDVIVHAGTLGDCMYFLSCGTVAVIMSTGKEICHLVDGAHFGEVCLLHADHKRIASVVAVEPCEVFRLDRTDFERCIDEWPGLREMMLGLANERAEYAYRLDEAVREKMMDEPDASFTSFVPTKPK